MSASARLTAMSKGSIPKKKNKENIFMTVCLRSLLTFFVSLVMVRLVLQQETDLACVAQTRRKVEGGVATPVLHGHADAVQD